jgi:hypothetical protein
MRETVIHSLFLFIVEARHVWNDSTWHLKVPQKRERKTCRKPIFVLCVAVSRNRDTPIRSSTYFCFFGSGSGDVISKRCMMRWCFEMPNVLYSISENECNEVEELSYLP